MTITCDCEDYEMPMTDGGNACDYCGCKPTKHALVMDDDKTDPKQSESEMNPSKKAKADDIKGLEAEYGSRELGSRDADVDDADEVVLVDNDEESSGPC